MLIEKRAVSEVISSLILLLIISVLGTSLYSYSLNVTNSQQNTLNQNIKNEAERVQELFKITSVWWSRYDDTLNVTVLNYGRLDVEVSEVYVNNLRVTSYLDGNPLEILTLKIGHVSFDSPVPIANSSTYELTVVSSRGVSYVHVWST
jgi:hypothetical protein